MTKIGWKYDRRLVDFHPQHVENSRQVTHCYPTPAPDRVRPTPIVTTPIRLVRRITVVPDR